MSGSQERRADIFVGEHRRAAPMSRKRHTPEEIGAKLREVDTLLVQGQSVAQAVKSVGITEVTYYRWRKDYGGPTKSFHTLRVKELEMENARLRRAVADLMLDKVKLVEAAEAHKPSAATKS